MDIFNIGNFFVLIIALVAIAITRRIDQQNRSIEGVRRFFDKAKKDFDAYVSEKQEHLSEMNSGFESFEKTGREALARIEKETQIITAEGERLNEVKEFVLELVQERNTVVDSIKNLKEDAKFVQQLASSIESIDGKVRQVDDSAERLLSELATRNEERLLQEKEKILKAFYDEHAQVMAAINGEKAAAEALKSEVAKVLSQKDESLITSLRAYRNELDHIETIYKERLTLLEEQAKTMESEGLYAIKENLEEQFARLKNLTETLFEQETTRFKEQLNVQINEFEVFTTKYRNIEDNLTDRLDQLNSKMADMEETHSSFSEKVYNLEEFMVGEFDDKIAEIRADMTNQLNTARTNLEEEALSHSQTVDQSFQEKLVALESLEQLIALRFSSFEQEAHGLIMQEREQLLLKLEEDYLSIDRDVAENRANVDELVSSLKNQINEHLSNEENHFSNELGRLKENIDQVLAIENSKTEAVQQQLEASLQLFQYEQEDLLNQQKRLLSDDIEHFKTNFIELVAGKEQDLTDLMAKIEHFAATTLTTEHEAVLSRLAQFTVQCDEAIVANGKQFQQQLSELKTSMEVSVANEHNNFATIVVDLESEFVREKDKVAELVRLKVETIEQETEQKLNAALAETRELTESHITEAQRASTTLATEHETILARLAQFTAECDEAIDLNEAQFQQQLDELKARIEANVADEHHNFATLITHLEDQFVQEKDKVAELVRLKVETIEQETEQKLDSALAETRELMDGHITEAQRASTTLATEHETILARLAQFTAQCDEAIGLNEEQFQQQLGELKARIEANVADEHHNFATLITNLEREFAQEKDKVAELVRLKVEVIEQETERKLNTALAETRELTESHITEAQRASTILASEHETILGHLAQFTVQFDEAIDANEKQFQQQLGELKANIEASVADEHHNFATLITSLEDQFAEEKDKVAELVRFKVETIAQETQQKLRAVVFETKELTESRISEAEQEWQNLTNLQAQKSQKFEQKLDEIEQQQLLRIEELDNFHTTNYDNFKEQEDLFAEKQDKLFEMVTTTGQRIEADLLEQKTMIKEQLEAQFTELNQQLSATSLAHRESLEQSKTHVNELAKAWENQLATLNLELKDKRAAMEEESLREFEGYQELIDAKFADLESKTGNFITEQERSFGAVEAQIATVMQSWQDKTGQLQQLANEKIDVIDNEVEIQLTEYQDALMKRFARFQQESDRLLNKQQENLGSAQETLDASMAQWRNSLTTLEAEAEQEATNAKGRFEASAVQYNEGINDLLTNWQQEHQHYLDEKTVEVMQLKGELEQTVAEFSTEIEQFQANFEEALQEKTAAQTTLSTDWQNRLDHLQANLEEALQEKTAVQTTLSTNWQNQLDHLRANLDEVLQEKTAAQITLSTNWQNQLDHLQANLEEALQEKTAAQTTLSTNWQNQLDHHNEIYGEQVTTLKKTYHEQVTALEAQIDEQITALIAKIEAKEGFVDEQLTKVEQLVDDNEQSIEEKMAVQNRRLEDRLAENSLNFENMMAKNQALGDDIIRGVELKFQHLQAEIDRKIDAFYIIEYEKQQDWEARHNQLENLYAVRLAEAQQGLSNLETNINQQYQQLTLQLDDKISLTNQGIDGRLAQVDEQTALIEGAWSERYESYTSNLLTQLTVTEQKVEDSLASWQERLAQLQEELNGRLGEAHELVDQVAGQWQASFHELEKKMSERVVESESSVTEIEKIWNERFKGAQKLIADRLEQSYAWSSNLESSWQAHFKELEVKLNEKSTENLAVFEQINSQWSSKYQEFEADFQRQKLELSDQLQTYKGELLANTASWLATSQQEQDALSDQLQTYKDELLANTESWLATSQQEHDELSKEFSGKKDDIERQSEEWGAHYQKLLTEIEASAAKMENYWQTQFDLLNEKLQNHFNATEGEASKLEQNWQEYLTKIDDSAMEHLQEAEQRLTMLEEEWIERGQHNLTDLGSRLASIEQESATLLLKLNDRNLNLDEEFTARVETSYSRLAELEGLWEKRYEELKTALDAKTSQALSEVAKADNYWQQELIHTQTSSKEQLALIAAEAEKVELLWQAKNKALYDEIELWLVQIEENAQKYYTQLEEEWQRKFEDFMSEGAVKYEQNEAQFKQIEQLWRDHIEEMNDQLNNQLTNLEAETQHLLEQVQGNWQEQLETERTLLNNRLSKVDQFNGELENRWQQQFSSFDKQFEGYLSGVEEQVEVLSNSWRQKYQALKDQQATDLSQLDHQLDEQQQQLVEKGHLVDQTSEIITQRLNVLEKTTFEKIVLHQENLRSQISEQVEKMAVTMREDWDSELVNLQKAFEESVAKGDKLVDEVLLYQTNLSAKQADIEENITTKQLELDQLFEASKIQMEGLRSGFDNNLKTLDNHYQAEFNQLEQALAKKSLDLNALSANLGDQFEELATISGQQKADLEAQWHHFVSEFTHDKNKLVTEAHENFNTIQLSFEQLSQQLEHQYTDLEATIKHHNEHFLAKEAEAGELYQKIISAQDTKLKSLIEAQNTQFATKYSQLEADFEDHYDSLTQKKVEFTSISEQLMQEQEDLLNEHRKGFSAGNAKLEELFTQLFANQQELVSEKAQEVAELLKKEQARVVEQSNILLAKSDTLWEEFRTQFTDQQITYTDRLTDQLNLLDNKILLIEQEFADKEELFREKLQQRLQDVDQAWSKAYSEIKLKSAQFNTDFNTRIDEAFYSLTTIEDRLNLKQEAFEAGFSEQLSKAIADLNKVQAAFDAKQQAFDVALNEQMERANDHLAQLEAEFGDRQQIFDDQIESRLETAAQNMDALEEELKSREKQFEYDLATQLKQAEAEVASLSQKMNEHHDQIEGDFVARINQTMVIVNKLESDLLAKGHDLDSLVHAELGQIKTNFEELSTDLQMRLSATEELIEQKNSDFSMAILQFENQFALKRDAILDQVDVLTQKLNEKMLDYDQTKTEMEASYKSFKKQAESHLETQVNSLRSSLEATHQEAIDSYLRKLDTQANDTDERIRAMQQLLARAQQETDEKVGNYRREVAEKFAEIEAFMEQAERDFGAKQEVFSKARVLLENELNEQRRALVSELQIQEDELKNLIEQSVKQTGEDLSLEFMSGLEQRLNDYEEALKIRMSRIENFIHDIDGLEESLRVNMRDIQENVLGQLTVFESDIRMRQEREVERASAILNTAQDSFGKVMDKAKESITNLQTQFDDLRRKALDNVTGQLTVFEEGFLEDIDNRERTLNERVTAWQQSINTKLTEFEREKTEERHNLERKFEFDQQNYVRTFEQKIEDEFMRFSGEISNFAENLESRTKTTEEELEKLRKTLAERMDFFMQEANTSLANRLTHFNDEVDQKLASSELLTSTTIDSLTARLTAINSQVETEFMRFNGEIASFSENFESRTKTTEAELEKLHQTLAKRMEFFMQEADTALANRLTHFNDGLNQKLASSESLTSSTVDSLKAKLTKINSQVEEELIQFRGEIASFSENLDLRTKTTEEELEKLHETLAERMKFFMQEADSSLTSRLTHFNDGVNDKLASSELLTSTTVDSLKAKLTAITNQVEEEFMRFNGEIVSFSENLDLSTKTTEAELEKLHETLTERMEGFMEEADTALANRLTHFNDGLNDKLASSEILTSTTVDSLKAKLTEINGQVEEKFMHFNSEIANFSDNLDLRTKTTEEELEKLHETLAERMKFFMQEADSSLTSRLTHFNDAVNQKLASSEMLTSTTVDSLETKLMAINSQVRENIDLIEQKFTDKTGEILSIASEDNQKLLETYNNLQTRANELLARFEAQHKTLFEELSEMNQVTAEEVEERLSSFSMETQQLNTDVKAMRQAFFDDFAKESDKVKEDFTNYTHKTMDDFQVQTKKMADQFLHLEERQKLLESNLALIQNVDKMRKDLETSLVDLSGRMAHIDSRRDEVDHLQLQLDKAFKINESLAEKLTSMARERQRFDELDGRIQHVVSLSDSLDEKIARIADVSTNLSGIQSSLAELEAIEAELQQKIGGIDEKVERFTLVNEEFADSLTNISTIEQDISKTLQQLTSLQDELLAARQQVATITEYQPKMEYFIEFVDTADRKIEEVSSHVTQIDKMRDWMVTAEKRFTALKQEVQGSLNALSTISAANMSEEKKGSALKSGAQKERTEDVVAKLYDQGWRAEQISSQLKMPLSEVNLILERLKNV